MHNYFVLKSNPTAKCSNQPFMHVSQNITNAAVWPFCLMKSHTLALVLQL
jgi:hypothetical protein